jgi:hypothetical protein
MKDNFGSQRPDAGSRFAERRSVPRFEFVAPVEITDPIKNTHIEGHVTEISQNGCFAEFSSLVTTNSIIRLRIQKGAGAFETWARVVYNRAGAGLGLLFIDTAPDQWKLLAAWLVGLKSI